ncbi:hypothetical protein C0J45_2442 [Silurus meridionalis]|nr:hypothetical protein C0J45_2442 [Silurus meridionalis]
MRQLYSDLIMYTVVKTLDSGLEGYKFKPQHQQAETAGPLSKAPKPQLPSYLALADLALFLKIKIQLNGGCFDTVADIRRESQKQVRTTSEHDVLCETWVNLLQRRLTYGNAAMSFSRCFERHALFKLRRTSLGSDERSGRPPTSSTVRQLVHDDRWRSRNLNHATRTHPKSVLEKLKQKLKANRELTVRPIVQKTVLELLKQKLKSNRTLTVRPKAQSIISPTVTVQPVSAQGHRTDSSGVYHENIAEITDENLLFLKTQRPELIDKIKNVVGILDHLELSREKEAIVRAETTDQARMRKLLDFTTSTHAAKRLLQVLWKQAGDVMEDLEDYTEADDEDEVVNEAWNDAGDDEVEDEVEDDVEDEVEA